jgi:hypothetical protein
MVLLRQIILQQRAKMFSSLMTRKASDVKAARTFPCEKEIDHYRVIQRFQEYC